jgi:signal transduction histidine kinase
MDRPRILVVEDEFIVAEDIAEKLRTLNYEVVDIVGSGEDAIEICQTSNPDLVLMDIVLLGDIDGIDAAETIWHQHSIPVVYLTAYADDNTLERAKLTEPFGYLLKPFQEKDLRAAIEIALSRHQVEVQTRQALKASEELRQCAEEQVNRQKQYVSIASHELRNPLATILLSAQSIELSQAQPHDGNGYLSYIQTAAKNMDRLIHNMLVLGRAESGRLSFEPQPTDVEAFCSQLVEKMRFIDDHDCQLILSSEGIDSDELLMLDPSLLEHILSNLLSNAIKYSPDGGRVWLDLQRRSIANGELVLSFQVRDEGIGIPPEEKAHLFETFHRCSNACGIDGNGLGLAIVQRAVALHDGEISVESELGAGSAFTVVLPYAVASQSAVPL